MSLFGTSGIRRIADRHLIELSLQVGMAVGSRYKRVVVGRDTRISGSALRQAVTAGLQACGAVTLDAGVLPTPTLAFAARNFDAGIMITASHNPPQYNGLKLLNPDGSAFSPEQQTQIEEMVSGVGPLDVQWRTMREGQIYTGAVEQHLKEILSRTSLTPRKKVVIDCGGGAAYAISPEMLTRAGCEVIPLNCSASGIFPHDVEPVEANLGDLMRAVRESGACVGIAHDGDADRVMAVDDRGRFISGDKLLAIFARDSQSSEIVTTVDASMSIEELGFKVKRTPVGDPFVSEELKKGGTFGGEPSGAWVFPEISLCPDGIYGAARIIEIARKNRLSELADSIPTYPVIRGSLPGRLTGLQALQEKLQSALNPVSLENLDGMRLVWPDGWLLIRPSGTEPKIRITSEARDPETARGYYDRASEIVKSMICEV